MELKVFQTLMISMILVMLIGVGLLVRNNMIYEIRNDAINSLYDTNEKLINVGMYKEHQMYFEDYPSYDDMLWDFKKWSYDSLYKELIEDQKKLEIKIKEKKNDEEN